MRMTGWIGVVLLAWACATGAADTQRAVRESIEMSMLVTGSIDLAADGRVLGYVVDQPEKLPSVVRELVEGAVPHWRFEPVKLDPGTDRGRARMGLRVIAKKIAPDNYQLRLGGASFGAEGGVEGRTITRRSMPPPRYPDEAVRSWVSGMVYLILKVGQQGTVEEAFAEQVNLTVLGNERQMARARKLLTDASTLAARRWRFNMPTEGELADDPAWYVRVPVAFAFHGQREPAYGEWQAYVPGPRNRTPWPTGPDSGPGSTPDAMIAGDLYPVGEGPRLATPLDQG